VLARAANAMTSGLTLDNELGFITAARLGRKLSGANPLSVVLPTVPSRLGSAQVLVLNQPSADQILGGFK